MLLWWSFGCVYFLFVFVLFEKNTENEVCVCERHFRWWARDREVAREPESGCRALLPCPMSDGTCEAACACRVMRARHSSANSEVVSCTAVRWPHALWRRRKTEVKRLLRCRDKRWDRRVVGEAALCSGRIGDRMYANCQQPARSPTSPGAPLSVVGAVKREAGEHTACAARQRAGVRVARLIPQGSCAALRPWSR